MLCSAREARRCEPFIMKRSGLCRFRCMVLVVYSRLISLGPKYRIQDVVENRLIRSIPSAGIESVIIALLKPLLKVVLILAPAHMAVISDVGGAIDTVSSPIVSVSAAAIFLARLKSLTIAFMYGLTQNVGAAAVGVVISSARLYPPAIPLLGV